MNPEKNITEQEFMAHYRITAIEHNLAKLLNITIAQLVTRQHAWVYINFAMKGPQEGHA